jgi:2-polyprenyl-3-methyl-5-hydroxy-6-metoxy-1,4-benzoquinol methylase
MWPQLKGELGMCIACSAKIDVEKQDGFADQLLGMINNSVTTLMVSIGHRSGLFDVMSDGVPRTSERLASAAGLNERYVREWLGSMVASKIVERNREEDTHRLPLEHAHWLSRKSATDNMAVFAQYASILGNVEDQVLECFKKGGGVPYSEYPRFHEVMAEDSGQSIVPIVVEGLVPVLDGMHERLLEGIDVLDVGCGKGLALGELAKAYPNSRFTGYDLSEDVVREGNSAAQANGQKNLRFEQKDLTHWKESNTYDWITAFDAIHDQARPDNVLSSIFDALRPGGVFLMQDIDMSSEAVDNIEHPLGALLYGISCLHCMTVSLAQGGMGLGAAWGTQTAERMLGEAGFNEVRIHRFEHDIQNAYFICKT